MAVNANVPMPYADMMMEELPLAGGDHRSVSFTGVPKDQTETTEVLIVGAGLSGICLGTKLKEAGVPFTIYEKNADVGGTWLENRYPGAAVDVPSHFYSFAFAPNPDWEYHFARQAETLNYLRKLAIKSGVRENIRFNSTVYSAAWSENDGLWQVSVSDGAGGQSKKAAKFFVSAVGQLNRPAVPNLPGFDDFKGQSFHTADWPDQVNVAGKRVALVGTGASAIQVGPSIARDVASLTIFQRSPNWAAPNANLQKQFTQGEKWALANLPYYQKWSRFLLFWASGDVLHASLQKDESWAHQDRSLNAQNEAMRVRLVDYMTKELDGRSDLLAKTVPDYPPYGKRMLRDTGWYKMLLRNNVTLVSAGVTEMTETGIVDANGEEHEIDICIFSTGFKSLEILAPMEVAGLGEKTLNEAWSADGARAYLGVYVPDFPNLFIMYGPNTNLAHGGSLYLHAEWQTRSIMTAIRGVLQKGARSVSVLKSVSDDYNARLDRAHEAMVWTHPGMRNWYRNEQGRVVTNSPWRLVDYWQMTKDFRSDEFHWHYSTDPNENQSNRQNETATNRG